MTEVTETVHQATGLFQDPYHWVVLSTIIFVFVAIKKGKAPLFKLLDGRSDRISNELDEAERIRVEAQEMLADYQRKHKDAIKTAEHILEQARDQAKIIKKEAEAKSSDDLKRREVQLLDRIARAEHAAMDEIRNKAADIAVTAAESLVTEMMKKEDKSMIDRSIEELEDKFSKAS